MRSRPGGAGRREARSLRDRCSLFRDVLIDAAALSLQERVHDLAEALVLDVVRRVRDGRDEAADLLVLAARARVEEPAALGEGLTDAVTVADVEVQKPQVQVRAQ